MQRSRLLERRDLALGLSDRHRAGRVREGGGQQIGPREHRLALREMRHRPGDRLGGRTPLRGRRVRTHAPRFRLAVTGHPGRRIASAGRTRTRRAVRPHAAPCCPRFRNRFEARHRQLRGLRGRLRHMGLGVEPEIGGLAFPHAAELVAVDVALVGARHQRRALGGARIVRRRPEAAFGHRRLDLGTPGRERRDRLARHAGDLEAPVGMRLLDAVAESAKRCRKLVAVEHTDELLALVVSIGFEV